MKISSIIALLIFSASANAGEWIDIPPNNLQDIEVYQANVLPGISEGVYIQGNPEFVSKAPCTNPKYIEFIDPKLADRVLSTGLFAIASGKTIRVWVDGCSSNNVYLQGKAVLIKP